MSKMSQKSQDLEDLKETITTEVHKAVKTATSDLGLVLYQALAQLNTPKERVDIPNAVRTWINTMSVPKTKCLTAKQNSNIKIKNLDTKTMDENDNLSLTNVRLCMVESSCPTFSDASWFSATSAQRKTLPNNNNNLWPDARTIKRVKIAPRQIPENMKNGLWGYHKKSQKWILVSKYGKCVCRRCLAPLSHQRTKIVNTNPSPLPQQFLIKQDKATNTISIKKTVSKIPVGRRVKEVIGKKKSVQTTYKDPALPKLLLTPNRNGKNIEIQTEIAYCSVSTQTQISCSDRQHKVVQTIAKRRTNLIRYPRNQNPVQFTPKGQFVDNNVYYDFPNPSTKPTHRLI